MLIGLCTGCSRSADKPAESNAGDATAAATDSAQPRGRAIANNSGPRIRIVGEGADARIVADQLPSSVVERCQSLAPASSEWSQVLTVVTLADHVVSPAADLPSVLGAHTFIDGAIEFRPRFPLVAGVQYQVVLYASSADQATEAVVSLPERDRTPVATVIAAYPSTDVVPENLLKFYLHFSHPMSRGEAYRRIRLLKADGKPVERGFYELDEELWDPAGVRFTLRFDPGRVKRGLKPREEEGPVLEEGHAYRLTVDAGWPDAEGRPLKRAFEKEFRAGPPDESQPDPRSWTIRPPAAKTGGHLAVLFSESLDRAMLERSVWILNPVGERVAGTIAVSEAERRWQFNPSRPWSAGRYTLAVDGSLEDLAGNSPARAFEVDVQETVTETPPIETVYVPFEIQRDADQGVDPR